ncbi:6-phosphogluconolactonase [Haliangium ochraceum]|uniref:6-phosphogluconolactonase n=1 Tax=Haliangium ochraceum (strain DSM 14365 / JCM 11303 / SMP-2) TaxID=502025 RepID=D0LNM1_HALO1|nr:6-phosphogluconolactonase [Haliangium ochraceum]ACY16926.1 6-phosphogluconolactonase [Haliangium ochraceum DSM 14365]
MTQTTVPSRPSERRFESAEARAQAMADDVAEVLRAAIAERGAATLVVSGGSTPAPMFRALSRSELDWSKVVVTLADERWVPADDEDSNERMVRELLLQNAAASARFVGLKTEASTPEAGMAETERELHAIKRPFDVTILGMGGDGHTASLFPKTSELSAALDPTDAALCAPVRPEGKQPRMTMTLPTILDSRRVMLELAGDEKWRVYEQALAGSDVTEMPIRAVFAQSPVTIEVYWSP